MNIGLSPSTINFSFIIYNLRLWLRPTSDVILSILRLRKILSYNLRPKSSNNQLFFINDSKSKKVLSSILKLEGFILTSSKEMLEGFVFALLLDSYVQVVKSWKISSSLFNLKGSILALSMDI